jgi:hypothetical protein
LDIDPKTLDVDLMLKDVDPKTLDVDLKIKDIKQKTKDIDLKTLACRKYDAIFNGKTSFRRQGLWRCHKIQARVKMS